jgi:ATP-dependent exoDNAse (exonuclease V) beta subunit
MRLERMKEEMRLLYVAVTRATYSLHLTFEGNSDQRKTVFLGAEKFTDYIPQIIPASIRTVSDMDFTEIRHGIRRVYVTDCDKNIENKIKENLSFTYAYNEDTILPLKSNVTAATALANADGKYTHVLFDDESTTNVENGIIAHKLLENYDFFSNKTVFEQAKILVNDGCLSEEELEKINLNRISTALNSSEFCVSPRAELFREKAFLVGVEAKEIFGGNSLEQVVLQGVIDLLIVEGKTATIVDYKYSSLDKPSLKDKYSKQLSLYAYAVEKVLNIKVSKKIVVNLFTGDVLQID